MVSKISDEGYMSKIENSGYFQDSISLHDVLRVQLTPNFVRAVFHYRSNENG